MALLSRQDIEEALARLGELANQEGHRVELLLVGGAAMVLAFEARMSTHDVDVFILLPREARIVRELAKRVAEERDMPEDWLNDAAKGYLVGISQGPVVFSTPGISARVPSVAQLLAMKLSAWRDDVDIADARRLLSEMTGDREQIWNSVEPYLVRGEELKAQYAFWDLWDSEREGHDDSD
jgi:hypothetical protein